MKRLLLSLAALSCFACSDPATPPVPETIEVQVTHPAGTDGLDYLTLAEVGEFSVCTWLRTLISTDGSDMATSFYQCRRPCEG